MRYAQIREMDISNGENIGVSLFVQGCNFHCKGCFNPETWSFNGGNEWTPEIEAKFMNLLNKPYVKRASILGGEPLADENIDTVLDLLRKIHLKYPNINIWLYTGNIFEEIACVEISDYLIPYFKGEKYLTINECLTAICNAGDKCSKIRELLRYVDILVDGKFEIDKKDITLPFRGSSNQRIIDVQKSLKSGKIVKYMEEYSNADANKV